MIEKVSHVEGHDVFVVFWIHSLGVSTGTVQQASSLFLFIACKKGRREETLTPIK